MREIKFRQYWQHEDTTIISVNEWTLNQLKQGIVAVDRHCMHSCTCGMAQLAV